MPRDSFGTEIDTGNGPKNSLVRVKSSDLFRGAEAEWNSGMEQPFEESLNSVYNIIQG